MIIIIMFIIIAYFILFLKSGVIFFYEFPSIDHDFCFWIDK